MKNETPDVTIEDQGSIVVFTIETESARSFIEENVQLESWQWLGQNSFAVDHRFANGLVDGMSDNNLVVVLA